MSFINSYLRINKTPNKDSLISTSTQKHNRSYNITDLVVYIRSPRTDETKKTDRNLL